MLIKKLFFIVLILTAVLLIPLSAQGKETLAVLDFTTEAVSKIEMSAIVEFLSAELFNTDKYIVIDVSQRETILSEMEFSMSGCSDDTCALEIGKMLSAEMIVTGNLSKVGTRYLMSVKMLQTETSRTMGTANGKFKDLDELIDGLENIAFTLAGMEGEIKIAEEPVSEPEPIPEVEAEMVAESESPADSEQAADKEVVTEAEIPVDNGQEVEIDESRKTGWLPITLSAVGALEYVAGGLFTAFAVSDMIVAKDVYELYMETENDPGFLYSGDGDLDYEHYYGLYERDVLVSMITSGTGGILSAASVFTGRTYHSFGGRITAACGTLFLTAGNVLASMSNNTAVTNIRLYNNYQTAGDPAVVDQLYENYQHYHNLYTVERILSYSLWGLGGAASAASVLFPGYKTETRPGLAQKIIAGTGYILLAAGNYTNIAAFTKRFASEDAYSSYESAGTSDAASTLFESYQSYHKEYVIQTAVSYGLWGVGAAAVITSLFLPGGENPAESAIFPGGWNIRPALGGAGIVFELKLR